MTREHVRVLEQVAEFIRGVGDLSTEEDKMLGDLEEIVQGYEEPTLDTEKSLEYVETTLQNQTLTDKHLVEALEVVIWDYKRHMELLCDVEEALNEHRLKIDIING